MLFYIKELFKWWERSRLRRRWRFRSGYDPTIIGIGEDCTMHQSWNGDKYWYNSDLELHREDGPAIEYNDGSKRWYINGKIHRDDGPAVVQRDGSEYWCINDVGITEEVKQWILDNNFPDYKKWDDNIKVLFKLKFG